MGESPISGADPDFLVTDPLVTLQQVLDRELRRADRRRAELAEIGNALLRLAKQHEQPSGSRPTSVWEPMAADLAPTMVRRLVDTTEGPLRHCVVDFDAGPGSEEQIRDAAVQHMRLGRPQRGIYPLSAWERPDARRLIQAFGEAGELQRVTPQPPTDFAIFGESAVMAVSTWGDAESHYVLIRDPMLVSAFIELFERLFELSLTLPAGGESVDPDLELLRLLGSGLKDEAIARYLGCSLRTVRRRVALLMDHYGADTRFQLGMAVARSGTLDTAPGGARARTR